MNNSLPSPSQLTQKAETPEQGSANKLLEREPESSYVIEWTQVLMREKQPDERVHVESSLFLFQLQNEIMALPTFSIMEVLEYRTIHRIPHRKGPLLLGTVNLRGQLKLCVSLEHLLEIGTNSPPARTKHMLAIKQERQQWVFAVQEVFGVWHTNLNEMKNVPVTIAKSTANYLKGILTWNNQSVAVLEEDLIFYSLKRYTQ